MIPALPLSELLSVCE